MGLFLLAAWFLVGFLIWWLTNGIHRSAMIELYGEEIVKDVDKDYVVSDWAVSFAFALMGPISLPLAIIIILDALTRSK